MKNAKLLLAPCLIAILIDQAADGQSYRIAGTNQTSHYNTTTTISAPGPSQPFYGQNAQYPGNGISYTDNGDGTITDNITGLMWQKSPDRNGDGAIDFDDKLNLFDALLHASDCRTGGYDDWRLPTIKELYSLAMFTGAEPSPEATEQGTAVPFMNTDYFDFGYGDLSAGDRLIDAQYVSSTVYTSTTMGSNATVFGYNFADGRIKGYPIEDMPAPGIQNTFYIKYVRGNTAYGKNHFVDNNDGTVSDLATGLMWLKNDNGAEISWKDALSYAEGFDYAGYSDWRLPDIKELQSLVDYTRCPAITNSPAIDSTFNATEISNEAGEMDYPFYWSSTTFSSISPSNGRNACYLSFGRAMGYIDALGGWVDVHGAGAQRSDPKAGNPEDPIYEFGFGPQGDAVRINNYVRLVRNANTTSALPSMEVVNDLNMFPNPATTSLTITLPEGFEFVSFDILNVSGMALYNQTNTAHEKTLKINTSGLAPGAYYIRVWGVGNVHIGKFIVQ